MPALKRQEVPHELSRFWSRHNQFGDSRANCDKISLEVRQNQFGARGCCRPKSFLHRVRNAYRTKFGNSEVAMTYASAALGWRRVSFRGVYEARIAGAQANAASRVEADGTSSFPISVQNRDSIGDSHDRSGLTSGSS